MKSIVISAYATTDLAPGGATSGETYQYFRLSDGKKTNLTESDARDSDAWDIAIKRSVICLNSGVAGTGSVQGCLLDPPTNASRGDFINLTDKDWVLKFNNITCVPSEAHWREEGIEPAIFGWRTGGAGAWKAPVGKGWKLRLANGSSYVKMRILTIADDGESISFRYAYQEAKDGPVEPDTEASLKPGEAFNFKEGKIANVTGLDWDIIHKGSKILLNGTIGGEGKGGAIGSNKYGAKWKTIDNPGDSIAYFMDEYGESFRSPKWYRYNIDGTHTIHPNGAVYGIKKGDDIYKAQIFFYNIFKVKEGDETGRLDMRIARL